MAQVPLDSHTVGKPATQADETLQELLRKATVSQPDKSFSIRHLDPNHNLPAAWRSSTGWSRAMLWLGKGLQLQQDGHSAQANPT